MKNVLILCALMTCSMISVGCTAVDPYTREEKTSNATKGAVIGAGIGALTGILSGDESRQRRKRALIGAGIGAIAGGAVGHYMDSEEARLRERLEGTGVSVTRSGDQIVLNMPGNITFEVDSTVINARFQEVLDDVAIVLDEYDRTLVEVVGHTDDSGTDNYNQDLSERRATAVGGYLARRGVASVRVATAGYGERFPSADNGTAAGRQANRRVELTLVPLTG